MGYARHVHECKRRNCKYHMPAWSAYGCNYAYITGKTRAGKLPPEQRAPADCPLYERGRRAAAPLEPICLPGSTPIRDMERTTHNPGGKPKYDWARGRELYGCGATDRQIAEALGCNPQTVKDWRQRSGNLPRNEG